MATPQPVVVPPMVSALDAGACRPTELSPGVCISSSAPHLQGNLLYPRQFIVCEDDVLDWLRPCVSRYVRDGKVSSVSRDWNEVFKWLDRSPARDVLCTPALQFMHNTSGPRTWIAFAVRLMESPVTRPLVKALLACVIRNEPDARIVYLDILSYAVQTTGSTDDIADIPVANFFGAVCDTLLFCPRPREQLAVCTLDTLALTGSLLPHYAIGKLVLETK